MNEKHKIIDVNDDVALIIINQSFPCPHGSVRHVAFVYVDYLPATIHVGDLVSLERGLVPFSVAIFHVTDTMQQLLDVDHYHVASAIYSSLHEGRFDFYNDGSIEVSVNFHEAAGCPVFMAAVATAESYEDVFWQFLKDDNHGNERHALLDMVMYVQDEGGY